MPPAKWTELFPPAQSFAEYGSFLAASCHTEDLLPSASASTAHGGRQGKPEAGKHFPKKAASRPTSNAALANVEVWHGGPAK